MTLQEIKEENSSLLLLRTEAFHEIEKLKEENERLKDDKRNLELKMEEEQGNRVSYAVACAEEELEKKLREEDNAVIVSQATEIFSMKAEIESLKGKLKEAGNPSPQRTRQSAENDSLV